MQIGNKVKQYREQFGWTQAHLAAVSGISTRTIQRIENGGECKLDTKMALASALSLLPENLDDDVDPIVIITRGSWRKIFGAFVLAGLTFYVYLLLADFQYHPESLIHTQALFVFLFWLVWVLIALGRDSLISLVRLTLGLSFAQPLAKVSAMLVSQKRLLLPCWFITNLLIFLPVGMGDADGLNGWASFWGITAGRIIFVSLYSACIWAVIETARIRLERHMLYKVSIESKDASSRDCL